MILDEVLGWSVGIHSKCVSQMQLWSPVYKPLLFYVIPCCPMCHLKFGAILRLDTTVWGHEEEKQWIQVILNYLHPSETINKGRRKDSLEMSA